MQDCTARNWIVYKWHTIKNVTREEERKKQIAVAYLGL